MSKFSTKMDGITKRSGKEVDGIDNKGESIKKGIFGLTHIFYKGSMIL